MKKKEFFEEMTRIEAAGYPDDEYSRMEEIKNRLKEKVVGLSIINASAAKGHCEIVLSDGSKIWFDPKNISGYDWVMLEAYD